MVSWGFGRRLGEGRGEVLRRRNCYGEWGRVRNGDPKKLNRVELIALFFFDGTLQL